MLQVTLNFGIVFAERERERERERESATVDKFYYSINKYVYMEGTAFVISVEKTILTPTLRSINIFF